MITIRKADERGRADFGWLDSRHTFSFGRYYDPLFMGYGPLRVINDDRVAPGGGFDTHSHDNMEIVSYVLDGALEHKDSTGAGSVIRPGDVQRMSAGTGVAHSEFNAADQTTHFLQIWFLPSASDIEPAYAQKHFPEEEKKGRLRLVASGDGRDGSISLNQDVDMYAGVLDGEDRVAHVPRPGRKLWAHVARGRVRLNGTLLGEGDGAAIEDETLTLSGGENAELLVFDMAP